MVYDVIVIGGGPAGAVAASRIARNGPVTLLIEKERLPRYMACGGGLTEAVKKYIDFDYAASVERVTTGVTVFYKESREYVYYPPDLKIEMVTRSRFDYQAVEDAIRSGAKLREGTKIVAVEERKAGAVVRTEKGEAFEGRFVVGADGANSVVARAAGLRGGPCGIGIAGEVYPADGKMPVMFNNRILIRFGDLKGGYGWMFPKGNHLSIGVATPGFHCPAISSAYEHFKERVSFLRGAGERIRRGRLLPFNRGYRTLNTKRLCLAGDAASLVDPFTAEGIRHAVHSGVIAAGAVCSALHKTGALTEEYTREVNEQIVEDFIHAMRFARIFHCFPPLFYRSEKYSQAFARLVKGEARYRDFVPGLYKWLSIFIRR